MKEKLLAILVKYATDNNKMLISEGIETAEITKYVKEQGVFYGQGYYFAKPMSYDAFREYLDKKQYKTLLDNVSMLEDAERLTSDMTTEQKEESTEDILKRLSGE